MILASRPLCPSLVRRFRPAAALVLGVLSLGLATGVPAADGDEEPPATTLGLAAVLEAAPETAWRDPDPETLLLLELEAGGLVVIELAPRWAPAHVENLKALVTRRYFDGLAILRAQDNYVAQWGDPKAEEEGARSFGDVPPTVPAELDRPIAGAPPFRALSDRDPYAPATGFSDGFPAARDPGSGRTWLVHCYGMVGAGRDVPADSGTTAQLYAVIGHAPRHLDRNVTLLGRVLEGMERLATLPRGSGALGFYAEGELGARIASVRLASELAPADRPRLQVLRTDTEAFGAWIDARRTRREEWFVHPVGATEVCNVPIPVRERPAAPAGG